MERQDNLIAVAKQFFEEQGQTSYRRICDAYHDGKEGILRDFSNCIEQLISTAKKQQEAHEKKKIRFFAGNYLLSSAVTGSLDFRISLLDETYYLDSTECSAYWCPSFLLPYLNEDKNAFIRRMKSEIIRVCPHEWDSHWRTYVCGFYYQLAGLFFAEHAKPVAITRGLNGLELAEKVDFVFGGVMDHAVQFAVVERDEMQ